MLAVFLIILHLILARRRLRRRSTATDAFTLGSSSLGLAAGVKLLVISLAKLLSTGIMDIFGEDDLGFIAIAGAVLAIVSYDAIIDAFTRKIDQQDESEPDS